MSADATSKLFEKLKQYKNYSNDSIFFKYIFDQSDIVDENSKSSMENDECSFKPEYTHQVFGDDEMIFGYKDLHIDYYLTPGTMDAYIGVKSKEKISPSRYDGIEPDDVYTSFKEFGCSPGFTKNLDVFCGDKMKKDLEFKPYGEKLNEYTRTNDSKVSTFEIYRVDSDNCTEYGSDEFVNYLDRVQTMLVYYIETSNFLDPDDTNWVHYFLYEKRKNTSSVANNNEYRYLTIGYLSVYRYYAWPDKNRSRISQIMIFPRYQNAGHGAELTESVLRDVNQNPNMIDVTAESPSPDFTRLRDFVTTKMCATLPVFKNKELVKKGFNSEMVTEALKHFKIPKLQTRRCYEILRMTYTNEYNTEEWRGFRLDVKKRFYKPFLNRSKYARTAGGSMPAEDGEDEEEQAGSSSGTSKTSAFESRFGGGSSAKFGTIGEEGEDEEEESESGVTTIGFGGRAMSKSSSKPVKMVSFGSRMEPESTTQIGFGSKATPIVESEQIGFGNPVGGSSKAMPFTKLTPPVAPTEAKTGDEEDSGDSPQGQEQLFMSDKEKKKYLETEFQTSVEEYRKIIKRLEQVDALP